MRTWMKLGCLAAVIVWPGLALATGAGETQRPARVRTERLWEHPGPVQDAPDAPRLLIVYPAAGVLAPGDAMRYAGRVEPPDAVVELNGEALDLHPGGLFTGTRPIGAETGVVWRFVAHHGPHRTVVERRIERRLPPPPAPRRPLAFHADPVVPAGDYWLPAGETLDVTLWASADAIAEVRVGTRGDWQSMRARGNDPQRGARYTATLSAPSTARPPNPLPVMFRLRADGQEPREMTSRLRMGRISSEDPPLGRITRAYGDFMKSETGSERWGQWIERTPFPILAVRGSRVRTDFGHGQRGWLETSQTGFEWATPYGRLPRLPPPEIDVTDRSIRLTWPTRRTPVAAVFDHHPDPAGDRLRVHLPGAASLSVPPSLPPRGPLTRLRFIEATEGRAPGFELQLAGSLWGYAMSCDPAFSIEVHTPPVLAAAAAAKPLRGLRVLIDPGHGGRDTGALGPSGAAESDYTLSQAAWLARELGAMGATVRLTRTDDRVLGLDERVAIADEWNADVFISLHFNSVAWETDPLRASGPIVFHHHRASESLARNIAGRLSAWWGADALPRVRTQNFRVLRTLSRCPAVLVETAFMSHPGDVRRMNDPDEMRASARAIAEGLRDTLQTARRPGG